MKHSTKSAPKSPKKSAPIVPAPSRDAEREVLRASGLESAHDRHEMTIGDLVGGMAGHMASATYPASGFLEIVHTFLTLMQMAEECDGGLTPEFRERALLQIKDLALFGGELADRVTVARAKAVA